MNNKFYAVRDKETGKLVPYLTSPQRRIDRKSKRIMLEGRKDIERC